MQASRVVGSEKQLLLYFPVIAVVAPVFSNWGRSGLVGNIVIYVCVCVCVCVFWGGRRNEHYNSNNDSNYNSNNEIIQVTPDKICHIKKLGGRMPPCPPPPSYTPIMSKYLCVFSVSFSWLFTSDLSLYIDAMMPVYLCFYLIGDNKRNWN